MGRVVGQTGLLVECWAGADVSYVGVSTGVTQHLEPLFDHKARENMVFNGLARRRAHFLSRLAKQIAIEKLSSQK